MKTYFKLPCPNCQQVVSVRTEYFGKRVACKHCKHIYTPQPEHVTAAPLAPPPTAAVLPPAGDEARSRLAMAEAELQQARDHAAARTKDADDAREEAGRLAEQLQTLRREADATQQELAGHRAGAERSVKLEAELNEIRAEAARLKEQIEAHRRESEEALAHHRQDFETQRHELSDVKADAEWLRTVVAEVQDTEKRAAEAKAKIREELDTVRAERDRLRDEIGQAQTDRLELARQHQESEDRAAQLHARIVEMKQALTEATAAHGELVRDQDELFNRWQTERQELQTQWEQKHLTVSDEAEERLRIERDERQQEIAALRRQFAEEKAALETEVGQAHSQAAELEKARQALADQLAALQQERDEFAVKMDQLEATRVEREERFQAELNRLNDAAEAIARERTDHAAAHKDVVEQLRTLHAERTTVQSELEKARGRLADLQSGDGQLDALRAERDQLREQVRQLSERPAAHDVDGHVLAKALEGVSPRAGWPWFESPRKEPPGAATAPKADAADAPQQVAAAQQDFTRERTALQTEVAKLKRENVLLRQYLENFGVQMIQM